MKLYALLNIILCFSGIIYAQEISADYSVVMGTKAVPLSDPFTISVVLRDAENRASVTFPDIPGLEKQSRSATSAISSDQGKKIVVQTISQQYFAKKAGKYIIPAFTILVNGIRIKSDETSVTFTSDTGNEEDVGETAEASIIPEPDENSRDIFLSVQTDKKSVYIREGFSLRVSLFVAEDAPVEMEFYRFNLQLQNILKALRPVACWEENAGVEEIARKKVRIMGKDYTEYNMYQAQLFPLTLQNIIFPSVNLEMLVTPSRTVAEQADKVLKIFRSRAIKVTVKSLPPHPLKDQVSVGQYSLQERLSSTMVYPGESIRYFFKIEGKGNIAAISGPEIPVNSAFDFYPPDISRIIRTSDRNVTGEKTFDYFIVPRLDGKFPLGRYFQWIYFDPVAEKYDTLRSGNVLQVKGDDYRVGNISLNGSTGLYDNLERLDSSKKIFDFKKILKSVTNAVVVLLLVTLIWVFRK